jgi:hypothetical protein
MTTECDPGKLKGKQAWIFSPEDLTSGNSEAQNLVESALRTAGMAVLSMESLNAGAGEDLIGRMKEAGRLLAGKP